MKTHLVVLSFLLAASCSAFAQNAILKAGVSSFFNDASGVNGMGGGISFEQKIGKKLSVSCVADYTRGNGTAERSFDGIIVIRAPYKSSTMSFRPELRFYPNQSMHGFFAGLGANLGVFQGGDLREQPGLQQPFLLEVDQYFFINPVLMTGIQLSVNDRLKVELSGGVGFLYNPEYSDGYVGVPIGFRLGYAL